MTDKVPTRKQVDSVLRTRKGGRHKDKRDDLDKRVQNEQLREFIRTLRKKTQEQEE